MVLFGHRVQVGQFVVGEERVRDPNLISEVTSERYVVFVVVGERETLVLPVLVQIDGDRVILCTPSDTGIVYRSTLHILECECG